MIREFLRKIYSSARKFYYMSIVKEDWIVYARRIHCEQTLNWAKANTKPLTTSQVKQIRGYWNKINKKSSKLYNIGFYTIYNKYCTDPSKLHLYIPDDFYFCYGDNFFSNYHVAKKLDNKNMFDLIFYDVKRPQCVIRKINGALMDADYNLIDEDKAVELCNAAKDIILKKSVFSYGGKGITFIYDCQHNKDKILDYLKESKDFIAQTLIPQHPVLASFNPESINTVRILTLFYGGSPMVVSAMLRMGVNGSHVDNATSGGVFCGINEDGSLKDRAYDICAKVYYKHPCGKEFSGVVIPSYSECVHIAKKLSVRYLNYSRLIAWDFAIDTDAKPVVIEAGFTGGGMQQLQLCNGPIWGDKTDEILEYLFKESEDIKKRL